MRCLLVITTLIFIEIALSAMNLVKAMLRPTSGGSLIKFMFNPTELAFEGSLQTQYTQGASTETIGKPKVSFSGLAASKITINSILFDTYEKDSGKNVVNEYIKPFMEAIQYVPGEKRPPIYTFVWGDQIYFKYCFIERLNYKLTMFMPDGTPVRATVNNLTLIETDSKFG